MTRNGGRPLATTLVRRIFAVYLALAIALTLLQINIEYRNMFSTVLDEIDATAHAFEPGVSEAVWNFQKPFLDSIAQGMVSGGAITGVNINDVYQRLDIALVRGGRRFDALNISRQIPLYHTYSDGTRVPIGSMTVYSNHEVVLERVKLGILLILVASMVKTAGLWFIIAFFANRLLAKPLQHFTEQIKSFDLVRASAAPRIDLGATPGKELAELRDTFHELAAKAIASKQLVVQKEAAEAANFTKSRFLAAASHDLRQPMHAMNLYLAMLAQAESMDTMQTCVDNLCKCAKAMNDMLDTLLDISSIDANAMHPQYAVFPIASVLDRMQVEFGPAAREKGLTLRIARSSSLVHSDEEMVERMLRNLVANAVRYTERGSILVGCRRHSERLRVAVYDTGPGIAPDRQQAIFEEYYQIDNHERNRAKGLGLGLAIVQRLAGLLGISVTLQSKPGKGSLFAFELPRKDLAAIRPVKIWSDARPAFAIAEHGQGTTILVVEDEPLILDATQALLESWGYEVVAATNGREALEQAKSGGRTPDAVLCDYLLTGNENGATVISLLRATLRQDLPAALITGDTLPEHVDAMRASGLPIMHKPLDHAKLKALLSQLLSSRHA